MISIEYQNLYRFLTDFSIIKFFVTEKSEEDLRKTEI